MKNVRFILTGVFALTAVGSVRADLRFAPGPPTVGEQRLRTGATDTTQREFAGALNDHVRTLDLLPADHHAATVPTERDSTRQAVLELPAAPGSMSLFLSAMVSIGAWQLVRSTKDLHFGALPDWYHTGGPVQVGHVTVFDLDFNSSPLCDFTEPVGERPSFYHLQRDLSVRWRPQHRLSLADPRGPPALTV